MAKAKKNAAPKKTRADQYDKKLAKKGSFADVFKIKKNKEDKKKPTQNDLDNEQELDERELGGEG